MDIKDKRQEIDRTLDVYLQEAFHQGANHGRGLNVTYTVVTVREMLKKDLSSQGVEIIDKEAELPYPTKDRMKLQRLKECIDKAVEYAEDTDPCVEFWVGDNKYELGRIGQFGVVPDVTICLKDSKADFHKHYRLIDEREDT